MAVDIKGDTNRVREEFDGLSNSTQVFIWTLVGLGVIIGLLLGGAIGYGVAVDEVDGRDCIEHDDELYCLDDGTDPAATNGAETDTTDAEEVDETDTDLDDDVEDTDEIDDLDDEDDEL